jgi:hypothetical protein
MIKMTMMILAMMVTAMELLTAMKVMGPKMAPATARMPEIQAQAARF